MNTLYFKYALEVERAGSISQAAQNLYMAQPNLSKAIKDLEKYQIINADDYGVFLEDNEIVVRDENGEKYEFKHVPAMGEDKSVIF